MLVDAAGEGAGGAGWRDTGRVLSDVVRKRHFLY